MSAGMWLSVDRASTDVSEELTVSNFRVEKFAAVKPASASGCRLILSGKKTSYIRTGREGLHAI
jgi:hypothetical protein